MSWQDYVDNQLLASQCVSRAAIAGHDGGVWAKSEGFEVTLKRKCLPSPQKNVYACTLNFFFLLKFDRVLCFCVKMCDGAPYSVRQWCCNARAEMHFRPKTRLRAEKARETLGFHCK